MNERIQKEMTEILGQLIDLALKPARGGELMKQGFRCAYCQSFAHTPPELRHFVGCPIPRARNLLLKAAVA